MKKNHFLTLSLVILILLFVQPVEAQFFKKLKKKLAKKENKEKIFVSDSAQVFQNWKQGTSDIILYIVTEFDAAKRTHVIGTIADDGSFTYKFPDSVSTSVPIAALTEECTNVQETIIKNESVKVALAKLYVGQNKSYTGVLNMVNPIEARFNLGKNKENNGEKGDTYLLLYADGDASISLICNKKITMRNAKGQPYKDKLDAESNIAVHLKKGWNILRNRVTENIPVGLETLHFTKNEVTIVDAFPDDIKWVYQPNKN